MPRLYELTDAYAEIVQHLEDATSQEEYDGALNALTAIETDIVTKAENYARIIRNKTVEADGYAVEIKRLQAAKRAAEGTIDRLKDNIHFALGVAGATELATTIGKWRICQNPPSVEITDAALIPYEYMIPQPSTVDKRKILDDYKAYGAAIPGAEIVRKESVRFR